MSIVFNLLLFTHTVSVVIGASTNVVMPFIAGRMAAGGPEGKALLGSVADRLSKNSQRALVVLVVTGLAMFGMVVWEGRVTSPSPWFIGKIALVLALLALLVLRRLPLGRTIKPATFGMLTRIVLLGIIFCSVMAFN